MSDEIDYPDDVARLRHILSDHGYLATNRAIQKAYRAYSSNAWAAGWMNMDGFTDDELFNAIVGHLDYIGKDTK